MNPNKKEEVILNERDYEKYSTFVEKMKCAKSTAEMQYYYNKAKSIVKNSKKK